MELGGSRQSQEPLGLGTREKRETTPCIWREVLLAVFLQEIHASHHLCQHVSTLAAILVESKEEVLGVVRFGFSSADVTYLVNCGRISCELVCIACRGNPSSLNHHACSSVLHE